MARERRMPARPGQRVQLHRALSKLGLGSRTEGMSWIRAGEIEVDGRIVTDPLTWIDLDRQRITRRGRDPEPQAPCTVALHKPRGVVTTMRDERGRRTVMDLLPQGLPRLFPVGRLDAESEGLLLLTNDSALSVHLTEPTHCVPKTYHVTLTRAPSEDDLEAWRKGLDLAEGRTRPAVVRLLNRQLLEIVLREGRNRQIRRMATARGHQVRQLIRVAIGRLILGDLASGACRVLTSQEMELLRLDP